MPVAQNAALARKVERPSIYSLGTCYSDTRKQ